MQNQTSTHTAAPHYMERFDRVVMVVIIINSFILFASTYYEPSGFIHFADVFCSLFFVAEMLIKMKFLGVKGYWKNGWNRLDGTLVILSIPSLFASIIPVTDLSFLLILRLLRVFRFFRVIHLFPNVEQIGKNFIKGLRESFSLFVGYFIIICIFAQLSTSLFGEKVPEYFGNPLEAFYSIFRLFTLEGWYDIPDAVAVGYGTWGMLFTRLFFIFLLIVGGIIGLSFINSIFVDAMVSDNNDDIQNKLDRLEEKLDMLLKEREEKNNQGQMSDNPEHDTSEDALEH